MEIRAPYVLIGGFVLAVIAALGAASYATLRLAEIEARAHFVDDLER